MKPSEHILELKRLIGEAGANMHERVTHAVALLADVDWIEAEYAGDKYKAAEAMEGQFFHDLAGAFSIWDLLQIHQKFPDAAQWKKRGWNLGELFDESAPVRDKGFVSQPIVRRTQYVALQEEIAGVRKNLKSKNDRIKELEEEVAKLKKENRDLLFRVRELERICV